MIDDLRRDGLYRLPLVPWINEFAEYISARPRFEGHVASRPRSGIWHTQMQDVMGAPYFLDYAKSFTPLASEYFGEPACLWSLNAMHTDGNSPFIPSINGFHRDREAAKILVLFMFATNVDASAAQVLMLNHHDLGIWQAVWGPKGTAWLADTTALHMGLRSQVPRTLVWARFANCIPQSKHDEGLPDIV